MNRNPFKRIAELEKTRREDLEAIENLANLIASFHGKFDGQNRRISYLVSQFESRLKEMSPAEITQKAVDKQTKSRLKRAAYARKYYAKKKAEKLEAAK